VGLVSEILVLLAHCAAFNILFDLRLSLRPIESFEDFPNYFVMLRVSG